MTILYNWIYCLCYGWQFVDFIAMDVLSYVTIFLQACKFFSHHTNMQTPIGKCFFWSLFQSLLILKQPIKIELILIRPIVQLFGQLYWNLTNKIETHTINPVLTIVQLLSRNLCIVFFRNNSTILWKNALKTFTYFWPMNKCRNKNLKS